MEKSQGRGNASGLFGLVVPLASVLLLTCALQATEAAQHQVGGTPGWSIPSRSNVNYTDWARTQTFSVGDTLLFNYSSEFHNVLQVTDANYNSCNAASPIYTWDDGRTIVELNNTGTFYFICGIPGHCTQGQKVSVLVQAASSSSSTSQAPAPKSAASPSPTALSALSSLLALSLTSILLLP